MEGWGEVKQQSQKRGLEFTLVKQEKFKELVKELSLLNGQVTPEEGRRL